MTETPEIPWRKRFQFGATVKLQVFHNIMLCLKKTSWVSSTQPPFLCGFLHINVQTFCKWLMHSTQAANGTENQDCVNTLNEEKMVSASDFYLCEPAGIDASEHQN